MSRYEGWSAEELVAELERRDKEEGGGRKREREGEGEGEWEGGEGGEEKRRKVLSGEGKGVGEGGGEVGKGKEEVEDVVGGRVEDAVGGGVGGAVGGGAGGGKSKKERKAESKRERKKRKGNRSFDFSRFSIRRVALKVAYLGWDYRGVAYQEGVEDTVEHVLFQAMLKTKLIQSIEDSGFSRAGRTDKGVSALGQVIVLNVRSKLLKGEGVLATPADPVKRAKLEKHVEEDEIGYIHVLNRVLPDEIRVVGWSPVPISFHGRFSALARTYRYFFMGNGLDIEAMRTAGKALIGTHDFSHFCKLDWENVVNFVRSVLEFEIVPLPHSTFNPADCTRPHAGPEASGLTTYGSAYQMYYIHIKGFAFLWHQVRFTVAVLFLVGRGLEDPSIVRKLLQRGPDLGRPQYVMASEIPLVLWDVEYENLNLMMSHKETQHVLTRWARVQSNFAIRAAAVGAMSDSVVQRIVDSNGISWLDHNATLSTSGPSASPSTRPTAGYEAGDILPFTSLGRAAQSFNKKYVPLEERKRCRTFAEHWKAHGQEPPSLNRLKQFAVPEE